MSLLQIPPNKGSSTYGIHNTELPPWAESGHSRPMWGIIRRAFGLFLAVVAAFGWAYRAFGVAADVVSMPEDAKNIQDAAVAILQKFADAPGVAIYPLLFALLLVGLALLFGWHPERGWRWPGQHENRGNASSPGLAGEFVSLAEAGQWLYANASERLQQHLRSMVPSTFETITDHAAALFTTEWQQGRCDLYGRRELGLPIEKIDREDGDFSIFSAVFGSDKRPIIDQSVLRRDLRPVLQFYEDRVIWRTPTPPKWRGARTTAAFRTASNSCWRRRRRSLTPFRACGRATGSARPP